MKTKACIMTGAGTSFCSGEGELDVHLRSIALILLIEDSRKTITSQCLKSTHLKKDSSHLLNTYVPTRPSRSHFIHSSPTLDCINPTSLFTLFMKELHVETLTRRPQPPQLAALAYPVDDR